MSLKLKKTHTISDNNKEIIENIENKKKSIFLGVEIIHDKFIERNFDSFIELDKNRIKTVPKWITLAMKRVLYLGAFSSKQRFENYMFHCKGYYMVRHIGKCRQYFFNSVEHLSFVQLMYIVNNLFMELVDPLMLFQIRNDIIEKFKLNGKEIEMIRQKRIPDNKATKIINRTSKFNTNTILQIKQGKYKINNRSEEEKKESQQIEEELKLRINSIFSVITTKRNKINKNLKKRKRIAIYNENIYNVENRKKIDEYIKDEKIEEINKEIRNICWSKYFKNTKLKLYRTNEVDLWNNTVNKLMNNLEWKIEKGFFLIKDQELWNINKKFVGLIWKEFKELLLKEWEEKKKNEYKKLKKEENILKVDFEMTKLFMEKSIVANKYSILMETTFGHASWINVNNPDSYKKHNLFNILYESLKLLANKSINNSVLSVNLINWIDRINIFKIWKEIKSIMVKNVNKEKNDIFKVNKINHKDIEFKLKSIHEWIIKFEEEKNNINVMEKRDAYKKVWGLVRLILMTLDILWIRDNLNDKDINIIFYELWNTSNQINEEKEEFFECEDIDSIAEIEIREIEYLDKIFYDQNDEYEDVNEY